MNTLIQTFSNSIQAIHRRNGLASKDELQRLTNLIDTIWSGLGNFEQETSNRIAKTLVQGLIGTLRTLRENIDQKLNPPADPLYLE